MLTREQFKQLRGEIVLNSLFLADYENSLGISALRVYDFFEGWLDSEMCDFSERHPHATPKQRDKHFNKIIDKNDINAMYQYYLSLEEDMLPIEED